MIPLVTIDTLVWRETWLSIYISRPDSTLYRCIPKRYVVAFERDNDCYSGQPVRLTITQEAKDRYLGDW